MSNVPHRLVSTNAFCPGEIHALRRGTGEAADLSESDRASLLADVRGNPGSTARLILEATTYLQGDKPNHNFVRFREGSMRALARSFVGKPFLRDHQQRDFLARGGTILASELVERDDGQRVIRQTLELVKPWAIESALDGTLDRFSIGWRPTGPVVCTVCHEPYFHNLWPTCEHELGKSYAVRGGEERIAEAEFTDSEGVEVSGVSVPGVENTSVDAIRQALALNDTERLQAALREFAACGGAIQPGDKPMNLAAIAKALGLAATVEESAILVEIERRNILLEQEQRVRAEVEARLAAVEEREAAARRTALIDRALREGKVRPNTPLVDKLNALALRDIEAAELLVNDLQRVTPVGAGLVSAQSAPPPAADAAEASLNESDREVARQLRLTPAQMAASKQAIGRR